MSTTEIDSPVGVKLRMLHAVRLIIASIGKFFFSLYYGAEGERIPPIHDDILKQPAITVAEKIRNKEITSVEVIEACIRRIKDVNSALNCFVEDRFEAALKEAREADDLVRNGLKSAAQLEEEKPFLGVPFTTKDCIAVKGGGSPIPPKKEDHFQQRIISLISTSAIGLFNPYDKDSSVPVVLDQEAMAMVQKEDFPEAPQIEYIGLHHTAGVVLRKDVIAEQDSDVVTLLRNKGAIIIGLTNVPELCMWWETHNHIHGRTKNAYNTTRIVGGSSGGEGCCQSAAGSVFGIGSDIGGSIRMPAYFNGVFGHKPSRNIVSNTGQYPIPETDLLNSFLGIGPITRHAVDLKPLMKILAGHNARKLNLDEPVDVKKLKYYYQFSTDAPLVDPVDPEILAAMKMVTEFLKIQFKIDAVEKKVPLMRKSMAIWFANMKGPKRFGQLIMPNDSIGRVLLEIVKNIFGLSGNTFIGLVTALFDYGGVKIGSEKYKNYLKLREDLERNFSNLLGDDGVFFFPTHPTTAPYHNEPLVRPFNFSYTAIINCLGLPSTTVPLGLSSQGLPIGIQVIANHNQDRLCFAVAEELNKAFGGWVEPQNS